MKNNKAAITLIIILSALVILLTGGMIYLLTGGSNIPFNFILTNKDMVLVDNYSVLKDDVKKIYFNLNSTDVEIINSTDNDVKIEYYSNRDNNAKIEYNNGTITVDEEKYDTSCIGICNTRRKIVVSIPNDYKTNYELKFKSGDLKSNIDLSGNNMAISTMSGNISLSTIGEAAIATMSGDVSLDKIVGSIAISTMSGNIRIDSFNIISNSSMSTMSGDVRIRNISDCYIDTFTKSGDVKVSNNDRKSDIVLKIETSSGDISIN